MRSAIFGLLIVVSVHIAGFSGEVRPLESKSQKRAEVIRRIDQLSKQLDVSMPEKEKKRRLSELQLISGNRDIRSPSVGRRVRKMLKDISPAVRRSAVGVLARLEDKESSSEIETLAISDPDLGVRRASIDALAMCSQQAAIPLLKEILLDSDASIRVRAASALGYLGDDSGYEIAILEMRNPDQTVRELAAVALGRIGRLESIPILREASERKKVWGSSAQEALLSVELKSIPSLSERIEFLKKLLRDGDENRKESAALALGFMGEADASESLLEIAKNPSHPGREVADRVAKQVGLILLE